MNRTTLRQEAYRRLQAKLLSGSFPPGTPLVEPEICREFQMSRTPVREAIRQMEIEGLLDCTPRFGAMVRLPEREEVEEMYTVREVLESYASAEAAERIDQLQLRRLHGVWREMRDLAREFFASSEELLQGAPLQRFLTADIQFHQVVIAAGGNQYLSRILDANRLLGRVFLSTHWHYGRAALLEAHRFHGRLLYALRAHDPEAARHWTVEAMRVSRKNALAAWDQSMNSSHRQSSFHSWPT